jgi:NADH-quinone oxidoreductase subunit N
MLAASMAVFMLSFTGVPPTLGFMGKFYLFRTVLNGGYVTLALIGVFTSLISAYYYLRVVIIMYMQEGDPQVRSESWINLTAGGAAIATVVLSLAAGPLFQWAASSVIHML